MQNVKSFEYCLKHFFSLNEKEHCSKWVENNKYKMKNLNNNLRTQWYTGTGTHY